MSLQHKFSNISLLKNPPYAVVGIAIVKIVFRGAPITKRCTEWGGRVRSLPVAPSVELPMGPRSA
eukprot:7213728-Pyramimonas_sp.AAC.1